MLERAKQSHRQLAASAADNGNHQFFDPANIHYIQATFDDFASAAAENGGGKPKRLEAFDVIFSNAALHWVSAAQHARLLPRLLVALREPRGGEGGGGSLALQMPDTRQQPSHLLMRTAAAQLGLVRLLEEVCDNI
jgi:hypothetical protein